MSASEHFQKHGPKYAGGAVGLAMLTAAFTAPHEGFKPVASHNSFDPSGVVDYGYGTTNREDPHIQIGDTITKARARELLGDRLATKYLPPLRRCIHDFDALPVQVQMAVLDSAYNLGDAAVCRSSMARNLNAGKIREACDAFMLYTRAAGKVLRGLVNRRRDERALCLKGLE